jgi:hypothetical protein
VEPGFQNFEKQLSAGWRQHKNAAAGNIDHDFFERRELEARTIVTLFDHPG